jgi:DNA invertase Pin-like site-specific DNA recombinase
MRGRIVDVGLARVSTRDQNPTLQIAALEQAGCDTIYEEKVSGVADKRPVRDEVLTQLQPGDTLTVWKLDRLGRSLVELLSIIEGLDARGVRFRCLTQPIDTSSAAGRLFLTLLAAFAEFERELMRERVLAGKDRMRAEGRHTGGPPLFGFEADHETINEAEAEFLRLVTKMILDKGLNLSQVIERINADPDGHPRPRRRGSWYVTSLRRVLTNPRTQGVLGDRYDDLQRILQAPDRQRQGRPADHLLSGILRCGRDGCGQPLYAATKGGKTGVPQMVYRCKKAAGSGGRFNGCGSTTISAARADAWAAEAFVAAVASDAFADALGRRQAELLVGEATASQLDDWRAEAAELGTVLGTRFGTEAMRQRRDDLQRMVREATTRLMAQPELQQLVELPKAEAALRAAWAGWTMAERRAWLRRVLDHIAVLPADAHHRGADTEARLDPQWKVYT